MTAIALTRRRALSALLLPAALAARPALAASPEIYTGRFSSLALGGHDTVAYFTEGRPVEGSRRFETRWKGTAWRFASQANLDAFLAAPERHAPRYGGYCAWAVGAKNSLAPGDARWWSIVEGRLYVNYDEAVQREWLTDVPGFIAAADRNWPAVLG
ncbi:MAG TPA: YHS domain-containing (seleno)protein [Falsiroseomonas sp.]|jgi:hypothetical protein|nr:YHS domain-containing (seleno)protein [Falsiroseomonas sp.]